MATEPAIKNGKGRVFGHPALELLHKSSPLSTLLTYGSVIALAFSLNARFGAVKSLGLGIALYLAGIFVWTLFEYLLHRYLFHFMGDSKFAREFHRLAHGYHHEYPRDDEHLFMPPLPGLLLSAIFLCLWFLVFGKFSFVFFAGFVNGYLLYSALHYAIHTRKPPKAFKGLWQHHALHHYKFPNHAFGVSSRLWDQLFRTMPQRGKQKREEVELDRVNEGHALREFRS